MRSEPEKWQTTLAPWRVRIDEVASCALNPTTRLSLTCRIAFLWCAVSKEVGSAFSTNRAAFGLP